MTAHWPFAALIACCEDMQWAPLPLAYARGSDSLNGRVCASKKLSLER